MPLMFDLRDKGRGTPDEVGELGLGETLVFTVRTQKNRDATTHTLFASSPLWTVGLFVEL
jgi:hypothetical protein